MISANPIRHPEQSCIKSLYQGSIVGAVMQICAVNLFYRRATSLFSRATANIKYVADCLK